MINFDEYNMVYSTTPEKKIKKIVEDKFKEYRCYVGGNLLCKARGEGHIEIQNPRNRVLNYVGPTRENQHTGPMGQQFMQYCCNLNCSGCKRLQGRAIGTKMQVEIKCSYCNTVTLHDIEKINEGIIGAQSDAQLSTYYDKIREYLSK